MDEVGGTLRVATHGSRATLAEVAELPLISQPCRDSRPGELAGDLEGAP